jgi:O-antigen biosynthesis protein
MKLKTKIAIKLPINRWKDTQEWGDYHIGLALKKEFEKKGCDVILHTLPEWYNGEDDDCDVVIVLRGLSRYSTNKNHFNIMWNISHPDMVTLNEYNLYDHVFIASEFWAKHIQEKVNVPVSTLLQCTDPELFYHEFSDEYIHELLFVGNSRKIFRNIIKDIVPTNKDLAVYGTNWDPFIDKNLIINEHIPNNELRKAYSSCKILLNDHWEDMKEKGFISNRIFDGFASGSFIISDKVKSGIDIFEDALVTYETPEELNNLIEIYLNDDVKRKEKALKGKKIVNKFHSFHNRVEDMLKVIENNIKPHLHFENSGLGPEVFIERLWNTFIFPIIKNIESKNILQIGAELTLTKIIIEYCQDTSGHLTLINSSSNRILDSYEEYNNFFDIITEPSFLSHHSLDYDVIFLDCNREISKIEQELKIIEMGYKNKDFPIIFLYNIANNLSIVEKTFDFKDIDNFSPQKEDINSENIAKNIENNKNKDKNQKDYHSTVLTTTIQNYIKKSDLELYYKFNDAYKGLIIISPKDQSKVQIIENTFNNLSLIRDLETEREKFSIAYAESRTLIKSLETKLIEKKIDLEIKEDEISYNLKRFQNKEDILKKNIKKTNDELQNLVKENEVLIDNIIETENQFMELNTQFDVISNNLYEFRFNSGKKRPLIQKIISTFPSLYILSKMNKTGFKQALIYIKAYKSIKKDNLVDIGYYLRINNDVELSGQDPILHYLYYGYLENRRPNPNFDGLEYLKKHADVKNSNLNPLVHYSLYGRKERRIQSKENSQTRAQHPKLSKIQYPTKQKSNLRGAIHHSEDTLIKGWLARIGDNKPLIAILKIDDIDFEIECNMFRRDLKENNINNGEHAFEFMVPVEFIDEKKHLIKLIDKSSGKLVVEEELSWIHNRDFNDFSGFLANSLVSPIIKAPFREEDKRCFAMMNDVAKHLITISENIQNEKMVSVIMPVYNRVDTIESAVNSVLKQSYENIELIIVDDGSNDGTSELVKSFNDKRIVLIHNNSCKGVSSARNRGLSVARGEYIAYLDSDNIWDLRYVSAMVGAFIELPDADALYGGQMLFRGDQKDPFAIRFGSYNRSLLYNRNYIDLNAFCHKKRVYDVIGGFNEELRRYVDYDWIMNISLAFQMYSVPVLLSKYYYDKAENTITNDMELVNHLDIVRERQKQRMLNVNNTKYSLKMGISIIIPNYESLDDIKKCLNTIYSIDSTNMIETIVVDNNSSKEVVEYLKGQAEPGKIKLIENKTNYGFTYAVNQGIEISDKHNDILILNNDAILTPGALETLQNAAHELDDAGLVVPQQVLSGGTKTINQHVPFANPDMECDVNLSAHHKNIEHVPFYHDGRIVELNFAPFFCVYIKREILEASVGLDAEFGRHFRSDRIFCDYVRNLMNMKIYYAADAVVYHELQKATDHIRLDNDKTDEFDLMFIKNQWEPELADELGFKKAEWDT